MGYTIRLDARQSMTKIVGLANFAALIGRDRFNHIIDADEGQY